MVNAHAIRMFRIKKSLRFERERAMKSCLGRCRLKLDKAFGKNDKTVIDNSGDSGLFTQESDEVIMDD